MQGQANTVLGRDRESPVISELITFRSGSFTSKGLLGLAGAGVSGEQSLCFSGADSKPVRRNRARGRHAHRPQASRAGFRAVYTHSCPLPSPQVASLVTKAELLQRAGGGWCSGSSENSGAPGLRTSALRSTPPSVLPRLGAPTPPQMQGTELSIQQGHPASEVLPTAPSGPGLGQLSRIN